MSLIRRLKSALTALSVIASLWTGQALAAGTIPLAMSVQVDSAGNIAAGCQLTFFVAGTPSQLQNAFADFALSQTLPNPLSCDQSGRLPMFWLADGLIHVRLTDFAGGAILDTTMQVLGPSSGGGGGGGTVDPTTIASTGDLKWRLESGVISGWVRINGNTIGNATSGATERANADCQSLFVYIWNTYADAIAPVIGGRGANGLADFNANKQITLLEGRARDVRGLDGMGNTPLGAFAGVTFRKGNATTPGSDGGVALFALTLANLPPYTPAGTVATSTSATDTTMVNGNIVTNILSGSSGGGYGWNNVPVARSLATSLNGTFTSTLAGTAQGGTSSPIPMYPPFVLGTLFWKL